MPRTGESFEIIEQALSIAEKIPDKRVRNQVHSVAGELYSKVGNFQIALQHELSALESLSDNQGKQSDLNRARALNNISKLYLRLAKLIANSLPMPLLAPVISAYDMRIGDK